MIVKVVPSRAGLTAAQTRDVYYGCDMANLQTFARFDSATGEGVTNSYDTLGRLLSSATNMGGTDPVGYDDQINPYAYVGNDPVDGVDPSGMVSNCTGSLMDCDGGIAPGATGQSEIINGHHEASSRRGPLTAVPPGTRPGGGGRPGIGHNGGPPLEGAAAEPPIGQILRAILGRLGGAIGLLITPTAAEAPAPQAAPAPRLPSNSAQLGHIFRDAPGHYPTDTPQARSEIQGTAQHRYFSHDDRYGNSIYGRINPDGIQTWVQVRNGVIRNTGVNQTPEDMNNLFPGGL